VASDSAFSNKRLDRMAWTVYFTVMAVLVVRAIIDQPMLLVIIPIALCGSCALLAMIVRLLGGRRRPGRGASVADEPEHHRTL
jgi:hypothetical protein